MYGGTGFTKHNNLEVLNLTKGELLISPSIKSLLRTKGSHEIITVTSPLALGQRNKRGVLIESQWKLNWNEKAIDFVTCRRITRFHTEYIMPSEISDRQKRAIRKYGSELFGVKPFRGLQLYGPMNQETLILATMADEKKLFIDNRDAEIWGMQLGKEQMSSEVVSPEIAIERLEIKTPIPQVFHLAYENGYSIRTEILQLIEQVSQGISALKRLKTLKQRGLNQDHLNYILTSIHKYREFPQQIAILLYSE